MAKQKTKYETGQKAQQVKSNPTQPRLGKQDLCNMRPTQLRRVRAACPVTTGASQRSHITQVLLALTRLLLLTLPFAIFFSFHPMLNFGQSQGLNFEISLLEITLVLFVLVNLPSIWRNRHHLVTNKIVWLTLAFAAYNTLSLLWAANPTKGLLITGLLWLLWLCFLAFLSYKDLKKLLPTLIRNLIIAAALMSVFALFQILAEIIGLPANISLLCTGCRATEFGFARVTAFAIEPQFFGSLLLAPILILLHSFLAPQNPQKHPKLRTATLILLTTTMFLTLSRGAIYALAIGIIVLLIIHRHRLKRLLLSLALIFGSFALSLAIQGLAAQANPNLTDNFPAAVSRTIHQLSLGIIDLRPAQPAPTPTNTTPETDPTPDSPNQSGYIDESTTIRTSLSALALEAWAKTPANLIFGTGTGSTGYALHAYFPDQIGDTEITQNQYTEHLLELGLIGAALFAAIIIALFRATRTNRYLLAILLAFLTQWFFFSGYPNALHIYLFLALLLTFPAVHARLELSIKPMQNKKQPKTSTIIKFAILAIIVAGGTFGIMQLIRSSSSSQPADPDTATNSQDDSDKLQTASDTPIAPETDPDTGIAQISVVLTDARVYDDVVSVAGTVLNSTDTTGTCTYRFFQNGTLIHQETSTPLPSAKSAACGRVEVPTSSLPAGLITVSLEYRSETSQGISEEKAIETN